MKQMKLWALVLLVSGIFPGLAQGYVVQMPSLPLFTMPALTEFDDYIVVFKDVVEDSENVALELASKQGFNLDQVYGSVLKGFAGRLSRAALARLQKDSRIAYITEDREVHTFAWPFVTQVTKQTLPTGVDRIDAEMATNTGNGISVAVIDTGIDLTHPDLKSSIVAQKNCVLGKINANDDNGHGTHVAGTIGGRNNSEGVVGVAPGVNLVAVKVLNAQGSGTWSQIICGID